MNRTPRHFARRRALRIAVATALLALGGSTGLASPSKAIAATDCGTVPANLIVNCGFEVPAPGPGTAPGKQYDPSVLAWTFTGGAGIDQDGSGDLPDTPYGTQWAFLAADGTSHVSQMVTLVAGTTYDLSFASAQENAPGTVPATLRISFNGQVVATVTPGAAFSDTTASFTPAASGSYTLDFAGIPVTSGPPGPAPLPSDFAHLDNVTLTAHPAAGPGPGPSATPEAPSSVLFGGGAALILLVLGLRSRRRKTA